MNDATKHFRVLINNDESSSSSFQSTVFWSVNVVLITLSTALFVWCVCGGGSHFLSNYLSSSGGSTSDAAYRERIRQLHVQIEEDKKEPPEERRKNLSESFHRNKVHMIVESTDFVEESMVENVEEKEEDAHETIMNATESMMEGATTTTTATTPTVQEKEEDYNSSMNAIEMGSSTTVRDDTATNESMVVMKNLDTCSTDNDDYDNNDEVMMKAVQDEDYNAAMNAIEIGNNTVHDENATNESMVMMKNLDTCSTDKDDENNDDESMMKAVQDEDYNAAMNAIEMGNNTVHDENATNESMVMMKDLDTCSTDKDDYTDDEVMMKTVVQELHVETGVPGYIKLRTVSGKRTVPNCCAVCLCPYKEGETIVWSSNGKCPHAFHKDCVVEWLIKMQNGTPCPCCRQEFTDLNQFQI